jgi:CO/xanthine dehydrogenase Mo-binding subunit/CO/xanthine dehydrogenase FAD-binding subunit
MSVGARVRPLDWAQRTLGTIRYTADLTDPPHLHAAVLRSPHPYAEVLELDLARAVAMPGVRAVITHRDFPPGARYLHRGRPLNDRPPLADGVVRHIGQEVAAVAARTRAEAEAACRAIRVRYRPRRAPLTPAAALARRARALHPRPGEPNVALRFAGVWGDLAAARRAAVLTVAGRFVYPSVAHAVMEPNTTLAAWDEQRQRLELWTSTQAPWFIAKEVAQLLGLAHEQVVCREVAVGGGFGSKSKISEHEVLAAALARKAGMPVLLEQSREEEFAANKPRHRFETTLRTSVDAEGRICLADAEILVDNGSYSHMGASVMRVGVITLGSMYTPEAVRFDARLVDTATQPGGQFRGYGTPQVSLAMESQVDELAELLGQDPIAFRLGNLPEPYSTTRCGYRLTTVRLAECLAAVRDGLDWDRRRGKLPPGRGLGVAAGVHGSGAYAYPDAIRSDAAIDLFEDGRVRVRFGGADAGTGQRTILAQVAATELGVAPESVEVLSMDGEQTPFELGAWSSRGTHMTGMAVGKAARELAGRLRQEAAGKLGTGPERLRLRGGRVESDTAGVELGELVRLSDQRSGGALRHQSTYLLAGTETITPDRNTANLSPTYAFAAHAAEVEVDTRTGKVRLVDYLAAHDLGRAINPTLAEGQIVGGAVMGIGAALGEELVREGGRVVNTSYLSYPLPRAADLPEIRPVIVTGDDPDGPYGAKSVGEMSIIPPGAAIANAVYHAVGVRIRELPITPDKVLTALAAKAGRSRRFRLWRRPGRWWIAAVRWLYPRGVHYVLHRWGTRLGRRLVAAPAQPARPGPDGPVELVIPESLPGAARALGPGAVPVGGATDAPVEHRRHARTPVRLVWLAGVPELRRLRRLPDGGLAIGAAVTLDELAGRTGELAPAIAAAVASIASPQIRAAATVAGNLLQANRCWFFRNGFACYQRNGPTSPCYAVLGEHRFHHAVIDGHRCQAVTPSDLATVLTAYDAQVVLAGPDRRRVVPVGRLYRGPGKSVLRPAELLVEVLVPAAGLARDCRFEKLALWSGDFAVAAVALAARRDPDRGWQEVRLVLGAAAPTPWRAQRVERALTGTTPTPARVRALLDAELSRVGHPLPGNVWKLDAFAGLAETAAERLAGPGRAGRREREAAR